MTQTTTEEVTARDALTNGDVFENLMAGDKVLWDGKKKPLTVTVGYLDYKAEYGDEPNTLFLKGPRGGEKMLTQNTEDRDAIRVNSTSLGSNNSEWIQNLRIVD